MTVYRDIIKLLNSWHQRIMLMVGRGIIKLVSDATSRNQRLQACFLNEETIDQMERFGEYGFASHPPQGCEAVGVFIQGSREHGIIIATEDRRYRIALSEGEAAIYGLDGQYVKCKNGDEVEVKAGTVTVEASTATIKATDAVLEATNATVKSANIKLGDGASKGLARVGDPVSVDPVSHAGTITAGSATVKAND